MRPASGLTSHRQPRQCQGAQEPKTVKGAQSVPNYVSRLFNNRLCTGISQNHHPCLLTLPFWTGRCLLFRNLFLILWFRSYSDIIIVDIICFICGGGAKIIVAPLRPACRAAAAAIGRYLLPAPDLSSRPSSRCCCCCRLTGRTDGHYVLCRPRSNHRNNNYIIHSDFITVSVELKFSHNVVNKSLQLL